MVSLQAVRALWVLLALRGLLVRLMLQCQARRSDVLYAVNVFFQIGKADTH